jgi:hypothetical protein
MRMAWHDLLFLHWPVPAAALQRLLPASLELETFDGTAWLGVVPFRMVNTRWRGLPPVPTAHAFPELNVRTYVRAAGKPGVWFFSLDAASRLAVWGARRWFHLPYCHARMACVRDGDEVHYESERTDRGAPPASFAASWHATASFEPAEHGSLAAWLTERYCLFAADRRGRLHCGEVHHRPWQLAPAEVANLRSTMTAGLGVELPATAPLALAATPLEVVAWRIAPVG